MIFQINLESWQTVGLIIDYTIKIIAIGYVPEGRRPSSSTAWLLAILLLPYVGLPLFLLMGSPYINRRRHRIQQEINDLIEDVHDDVPDIPTGMDVSAEVESVIKLNRRLTRMPAVTGGNNGFYSDYRESLKRMTAAIDEAEEYIYVEIYIMAWDSYTQPFFAALERAHNRGVKVRLLFDHVGSWKYPATTASKKNSTAWASPGTSCSPSNPGDAASADPTCATTAKCSSSTATPHSWAPKISSPRVTYKRKTSNSAANGKTSWSNSPAPSSPPWK